MAAKASSTVQLSSPALRSVAASAPPSSASRAAQQTPTGSSDVFFTPLQATPNSTGNSKGRRTAAASGGGKGRSTPHGGAAATAAAAAAATPTTTTFAVDGAADDTFFTPSAGDGLDLDAALGTAASPGGALAGDSGMVSSSKRLRTRPLGSTTPEQPAGTAICMEQGTGQTSEAAGQQGLPDHQPGAARQLLGQFEATTEQDGVTQTPAATQGSNISVCHGDGRVPMLTPVQQLDSATADAFLTTPSSVAGAHGQPCAVRATDCSTTSPRSLLAALTPMLRRIGGGLSGLSARKTPHISSGAKRVPVCLGGLQDSRHTVGTVGMRSVQRRGGGGSGRGGRNTTTGELLLPGAGVQPQTPDSVPNAPKTAGSQRRGTLLAALRRGDGRDTRSVNTDANTPTADGSCKDGRMQDGGDQQLLLPPDDAGSKEQQGQQLALLSSCDAAGGAVPDQEEDTHVLEESEGALASAVCWRTAGLPLSPPPGLADASYVTTRRR
jgi:hypothetical protein